MSDTTTVNALPMPQLADRANIETAVRPLAQAIDTRLVARFGTLAARNTAITAPVPGQMCWVTETTELYVHNGAVWISATARTKRLASPETRTSTTYTPSSLTLDVEPFSAYRVRFWSVWTSSTDSPGVKVKWFCPVGAISVISGPGPAQTTTNSSVAYGQFSGVVNGGTDGLYYGCDSANYAHISEEGVIITGATGGAFYIFTAHAAGGFGGQTITMGAALLETSKVA